MEIMPNAHVLYDVQFIGANDLQLEHETVLELTTAAATHACRYQLMWFADALWQRVGCISLANTYTTVFQLS